MEPKYIAKRFHFRSFVAFFIFLQFMVMSVTGIILYFTPPGRIARWTDWIFVGMSKDQLEAIHTISSFAWFIAALLHVFLYNRKVMWGYIKKKTTHLEVLRRKYRREMVTALLLTIVFFVGTYIAVVPFSSVIDIGDALKKSWGDKSLEAPVPGAESLTLKEFSLRVLNLDAAKARELLQAEGFSVKNADQKLKEIARLNGCSPARIYEVLKNPGGMRYKHDPF
ncbi:MAG: DUF4405 domain-containing protein [bacterium]|nr:DUF4405 domain-containing protein [bacterium]